MEEEEKENTGRKGEMSRGVGWGGEGRRRGRGEEERGWGGEGRGGEGQ